MVNGLDFFFDQRNWEIFGNCFCLCEVNQILLFFFGKTCKFLDIIELGAKRKKERKKRKKTAIVFPWQLGHQFILFVEMLKISPKNVFTPKKKKKKDL
jgi:hypothetical protein